MDRQRVGGNLRADAGLAAEVGKVGGEPVAEVDGGGGEAAAQQCQPHGDAGLRAAVADGPRCRVVHRCGKALGCALLAAPFHLGQFGGRATQFAGHVEGVAGRVRRCAAARGPLGPIPPAQCLRAPVRKAIRWCRHRPAEPRMRSARPRSPAKKPLDPAPPAAGCQHLAGQRQREESRQRTRAHCGQVAQAARQRPVADRLGRVPVAAEVASFQREVGRDQQLVTFRRAQDGAVVADAERQIRPRRPCRPRCPAAPHPTRTGCARSAPVRPFLVFIVRPSINPAMDGRDSDRLGARLRRRYGESWPSRRPETLWNSYNLSVDSSGKWIALTGATVKIQSNVQERWCTPVGNRKWRLQEFIRLAYRSPCRFCSQNAARDGQSQGIGFEF